MSGVADFDAPKDIYFESHVRECIWSAGRAAPVSIFYSTFQIMGLSSNRQSGHRSNGG